MTDTGADDRELLRLAADALRSFSLRALSVRPFLEVPYRDMPSLTPWGRTIEPEARKAHDLSIVIRKHLKAGRTGGPVAADDDEGRPPWED